MRRVYQEEQRSLSGRRIPGVERPQFNGKSSFSSGLRCCPPFKGRDETEQEFRDYKSRYLEDNPIRGKKVAEEVRSLR